MAGGAAKKRRVASVAEGEAVVAAVAGGLGVAVEAHSEVAVHAFRMDGTELLAPCGRLLSPPVAVLAAAAPADEQLSSRAAPKQWQRRLR